MKLIAGRISFKIDGEIFNAKGYFTYNLGADKKEVIVGSDGVHGYKSTPQSGKIEGKITDAYDIDLKKLVNTSNATVSLELANGKTVVLREAVYTGDGNVTTDEAEIDLSFEGTAEEVK